MTYDQAVKDFQRRFLIQALREERGIMTRAARRVGVHRNTFHRLLVELGVDSRRMKDSLGIRHNCTVLNRRKAKVST